tara:strand:- start:228 stop:464 length:237 start_codon:yes stop_codon:yes gene_type:complete
MSSIVKVPKLGDSAESIYIIEWKVSVGDNVNEGDVLLVADTNKVQVEIPSPVSGKITEIYVDNDEEINVGEPLCEINS